MSTFFKLDTVIPFGRTFDTYRAMFNLRQEDFKKSILSVADGPASFNAEGTALGLNITSVDPIYTLSINEISEKFHYAFNNLKLQATNLPEDYCVFTYHSSFDDAFQSYADAFEKFSQDYPVAKESNRYIPGAFPVLNFNENQFELALSSYCLFSYSDHFDTDFHIQCIYELLRVAEEVRIYPLFDITRREISKHLDPVLKSLGKINCDVSMPEVAYRLIKGEDRMLRIIKNG